MKRIVSLLIVLFALAPFAAQAKATPLVDTAWLQTQLDANKIGSGVAVIDIRNKIDKGSAKTFAAGHVPGSVYSNYLSDGWRVTVNKVVGKLPPVGDLEKLVRKLGVKNSDHVVIVSGGVNSTDFGSAARVYWTFKVLGHDAVSILDGGYAAWKAAGAKAETGASNPKPSTFSANYRADMVITTADVLKVVENGGAQLVDARPTKQFKGLAKHKKALAPGTIPTAVSLPQGNLVPGKAGRPLTGDALAAVIGASSVKTEGAQIAFCNTGHWAATAWFALSELAGNADVKMYDGSMVEWTADKSLPLVVTKANNVKS